MKKVLITREMGVNELKEFDSSLDINVTPLIKLTTTEVDLSPLSGLTQPWLISSSRHGIKSFIDNLKRQNLNFQPLRVFVVGLRSSFLLNHELNCQIDSFETLEDLVKQLTIELEHSDYLPQLIRVVGNRSLNMFDSLKDSLAVNNKVNFDSIYYQEIITYHNEQLNSKIDLHQDGVLFFSPSAAKSFFDLVKKQDLGIIENKEQDKDRVAFCIGSTTQNALETYNQEYRIFKKVVISDSPNFQGLCDSVNRYFNSNNLN